MIKEEANIGKDTNASDNEKSEEASSPLNKYIPDCTKPKVIKRRKDVIVKAILRECRRFFQVQVNNLTGFVTSK